MFKAYSLGRLFGVDLRVHSTLVWLVALVGVGSLITAGPAAALVTLMTIGMLALSVTLHELGHIGAVQDEIEVPVNAETHVTSNAVTQAQ